MAFKVRFAGLDLVAEEKNTGWIGTLDDYLHGRPSYAHLMPDGSVMRYGQRIGSVTDIQWGGEFELPDQEPDAIFGLLGPGWWNGEGEEAMTEPRFKVEIVRMEDCESDDYRKDLVITHDGKEIARHCGGGEPEDNTFGRDWHWVAGAILDAYARGLADGKP